MINILKYFVVLKEGDFLSIFKTSISYCVFYNVTQLHHLHSHYTGGLGSPFFCKKKIFSITKKKCSAYRNDIDKKIDNRNPES